MAGIYSDCSTHEIIGIQSAQCWFPGLAIFNAKYQYIYQTELGNCYGLKLAKC